MTGALVLWSHALAALLFGAAALAAWRRPDGRLHAAFATALLLSALWALAVAGIDARDLGTRTAQAGRDLAWLGFMLALVRRARAGGLALSAVYVAVAAVATIGLGLSMAEAAMDRPTMRADLELARLSFDMMTWAGSLVLVLHLYRAATGGDRLKVRLVALALATLWSMDFAVAAVAYGAQAVPAGLIVARGLAASAVALLLIAAAQRRDGWSLALSRPAAMRALGLVALCLYLGAVAGATVLVARVGGPASRAVQAAIVIGAAAALLAAWSTSWWAAWAKVKLAKHLFSHRYDYRTEWQRFTGRLGGGGAPLEERVAQAVAELLDAPAALLLGPDRDCVAWRWTGDAGPLSAAFTDYLAATGRIVELDAVRERRADEQGLVPAWMLAAPDAWALVPLVHGEALAGAVLLARPPVPRALDWEDFDLLRVAGRQAASYLAEDRAGRALAEAQRFDEFHRRFAFILHDIKNLVSQQQLVARNAERHADNPAFRADMIATLRDSADRMTSLIARLSRAEAIPAEALGPVNCAALLHRAAAARRAGHPVTVQAASCFAVAHPHRLEQALGHLVQNAVEASAPGEPVILTATHEGTRVVIDVADRGPGMSAAFIRDELFRPFASTKPGGFGIGVYEARQLVAAMGGELGVDSREGAGTRFRIVLPAAPAMEAAA
jgi:putative PEP-CTERM system histidine kinase